MISKACTRCKWLTGSVGGMWEILDATPKGSYVALYILYIPKGSTRISAPTWP